MLHPKIHSPPLESRSLAVLARDKTHIQSLISSIQPSRFLLPHSTPTLDSNEKEPDSDDEGKPNSNQDPSSDDDISTEDEDGYDPGTAECDIVANGKVVHLWAYLGSEWTQMIVSDIIFFISALI